MNAIEGVGVHQVGKGYRTCTWYDHWCPTAQQVSSLAMGGDTPFSLLNFKVIVGPSHAETGLAVHVVGDHPALGCWDVGKSIQLHAEQSERGLVWSSPAVSVPSGALIQYKYILCINGQLQRWENIAGNRSVIADQPNVTLCDEIDHSIEDMRQSLPDVQSHSEMPLLPTLPALAPPLAPAGGGVTLATIANDDSAVLVVSYILPLVIAKTGDGWSIEWNQDSITAKKQHMSERKRVTWIGCPGLLVAEEDQASLTSALQAYSCVPIFLDAELEHSYYFGFCRSFLWPTFHNVIKARRFHEKVWRAYCTANRKFADKVIEVYDNGDLVWVHDYHLLLLPSYILRKLRTARVGLFLHTPFPSSEIFRTIPVRDELLRGMLNTDLIGFHIFEYARHFLTCCKRMLGLQFDFHPGGFIRVRDHKRDVLVQVSHVGIQPELCAAQQLAGIASAARWEPMEQLRQLRAAGKTVMLGIDEMERLKGVPLKLLAFEQLLLSQPERREHVAFVQVGVKACNFTPAVREDFEELRAEVLEIISRISEAFPGALSFIELPTISLAQRMQLWALADVAWFSPIREGVNTFPLEAVYARRTGSPGVVIVSEVRLPLPSIGRVSPQRTPPIMQPAVRVLPARVLPAQESATIFKRLTARHNSHLVQFASSARVLNGALRVNPWNTEETTNALEREHARQSTVPFLSLLPMRLPSRAVLPRLHHWAQTCASLGCRRLLDERIGACCTSRA